jgi:hypothetical protein
LMDDIVFSALAWYLLTDAPLAWDVIVYTYILGCFGIRMVMTILSIPIIYLARFCKPKGPQKKIPSSRNIKTTWMDTEQDNRRANAANNLS